MSALPPPVLEQAHVRLAADYAELREEYDNARKIFRSEFGAFEAQADAAARTVETQQVTIEALTAILGAMRDNERTMRGEITSLTNEVKDLASRLLEAGKELAIKRALHDTVWKYAGPDPLAAQRASSKERGGFIWTNGGDQPTHKWDLRS